MMLQRALPALARRRYWCSELVKAHLHRLGHRGQLTAVRVRPGLATASHVVVMVVHNESARLPYLLDYYRDLGFGHFVVVDNESDDGLDALLAAAPDVSTYRARGSYGNARYGNDWINQVLSTTCVGKWVLYVDADEFLVYAGSPQTPIAAVTAELDRLGAESLHTVLLDLYSEHAIERNVYRPGTDPLEVCSLFDTDGYEVRYEERSQTTWVKGGVRGRVFFADVWDGPALNKTPLVRWRRHFAFTKSSHQLFPPRLNGPGPQRLDGLRGSLLHFKFLASFGDLLRAEQRRQQHTREYSSYHSLDTMTFVGPSTAAYAGWRSVADAGLLDDRPFAADDPADRGRGAEALS